MSLTLGVTKDSVFFDRLWTHPKFTRGRLALPESDDKRVLLAADYMLCHDKLSELWLFTPKERTLSLAKGFGVDLSLHHKKIVWASDRQGVGELTKKVVLARRKKRGKSIGEDELLRVSQQAFFQAGSLLADGQLDAAVAGACAPTADVLRGVLGTCGLKESSRVLSGSMLMEKGDLTGNLLYADMAVIPDPDKEAILDIAKASVATWQALFPENIPPRVAFLSFSTKGSAKSASSEKMAAAAKAFQQECPAVESDGELQFDAAMDGAVRERKAKGSLLKGDANIFIFPNLDAGNISYKVTQRLGGYRAVGPILQGAAKPFFDLSRGASEADIVKTCMLALCLAD